MHSLFIVCAVVGAMVLSGLLAGASWAVIQGVRAGLSDQRRPMPKRSRTSPALFVDDRKGTRH